MLNAVGVVTNSRHSMIELRKSICVLDTAIPFSLPTAEFTAFDFDQEHFNVILVRMYLRMIVCR